MRMFFKDLRNDPIWQCIDISDLIYSYSDLPSQTTSKFYLQNIRTLLIEGFTDIELRRLCYDDPDFSPVYEQLSQAMGKDQIIDKLIEYAERRELIERLLALTKKKKKKKYEKHQPYVNNLY